MKITRIYTQEIPATRFIGVKYGDSDRVNGGFGVKWGEAFQSGLFDKIEAAAGCGEFFEDSGAYIGLMRSREGEPFEYWIGMFTPENTAVPDGMSCIDFPASTLGVGWIYGTENEIYCKESDVAVKLDEEGHSVKNDDKGACWFFERYQCPRYTCPDENGRVTLDIGCFVEK